MYVSVITHYIHFYLSQFRKSRSESSHKHETSPAYWMKNSVVWYSQILTEWLGIKRFNQYVTASAGLLARIKTNKNYTAAIGQDLWLIGTHTPIDPTTWKPVLSIQNNAGHPTVIWTKGDATAIEIWVDRGDEAGFVLLTMNTEPNTADGSPLPPNGTSAVWKYKAIYHYHDTQVGQWSDVISMHG